MKTNNWLKAALAALASAALWAMPAAGGGLKLTGIETESGVRVTGTGGTAGNRYDLQWTENLGAALPWETVGSGLAKDDGTFGIVDEALNGPGFYCVRANAPEADTYLVVDMSGGPSAAKWPVTELASIPDGGWTDEYKTGKLVLRRIPAGTFTMGSPTGELGRYDREVQHQVTISRPFYMGVFEVTQRQWELAMGTRPSYFTNNACYRTRPVESVSYADIRGSKGGAEWPLGGLHSVDSGSFLYVLREKTGLAFDLPTEAQWEYACRAGTTNALNSGKDLTHPYTCTNVAAVARYSANGGQSTDSSSDTATGTAPVGSYIPNHWDLYDMHGNVWEWCLDWYGAYDTAAPTDPVGPASGELRVRRSGSTEYYNSGAHTCRSATRGRLRLDAYSYYCGFRVAFLP